MSDIQRAGTTPRYSDYTLHNGVVYCVEVPPDEAADIRTQTAAMLASLETLLASAGSDFHAPGEGGRDVGLTQDLPPVCVPVWSRFTPPRATPVAAN